MENYIGCSGYHYKDWKKKFYPPELKQKEWLPFYAEQFNTVEINNSFYKTPTQKTLHEWYHQTPDKFVFTMKGSRYITHMKKLKEVSESVSDFYASIKPLKEKAGVVLWQLPGNLHENTDKLDKFCKMLTSDYLNVLEFRHASWFSDGVREVLDKHEVTMCSLSAPGDLPETLEDVSGEIYLRLHGKNEWYKHHYTDEELNTWVKKIKKSDANQCYVYFNNDVDANAPENARRLKELL